MKAHTKSSLWTTGLPLRVMPLFLLAVSALIPATAIPEGEVTSEVTKDVRMGKCGGVAATIHRGPGPHIGLAEMAVPFDIAPSYDASITAADIVVITEAMSEWEGIILTAGYRTNPLPVTFRRRELGFSLGATASTINGANGNIQSAIIDIDSTGDFYVDPTPANDNDDAYANTDLLTVVRHEIGHAVGWLQAAQTARVGVWWDGCCNFDPTRLNIATIGGDAAHANFSIHLDDLMEPNTPVGRRRPISFYPDAAYVARAFNCDVTMQFVDLTNVGSETGSANEPWNTFAEGVAGMQPGWELLLINGMYTVTPPYTITTEMTVRTARGGVGVVE